ncbi:hypothetical protein N7474_010337 [Penicillium riverlandense]|uniref:uncharacterized protein n=1 Tax=Penicillium riverlandense TaxID=1903569 RepID=UPI0025466FC9|nr:uncharacterized protein N7474_010337 [Penicillium riverlandense]KAJ5806745.1 hypothetical protein N7474_010337 [Penicillium riverlandense]
MSLPSNNPHPVLSSSSSRQSMHSHSDIPTRPAQKDHPSDEQRANQLTSPTHDSPGGEETSGAQDQQPTNPPFQPFFTLIEDAHTSEYHHPTVHYLFSDDDTDIITEAALRSLEAQQESLPESKREQIIEGPLPKEQEVSPRKSTILIPPPVPGVREHYIILDVAQDGTLQNPITAEPSAALAGKEGEGVTKSLSSSPANPPTIPPPSGLPTTQFRVTSAKSLTPTWQVLKSELVPAPTFENSNPGNTPGHGLMLKIHGTAGILPSTPRDKAGGGSQRLEEMMDQFAKRMSELQTVIEAGETDGSVTVEEGELQSEAQPQTRAEEEDSTEVGVRKDDDESARHASGDVEHS